MLKISFDIKIKYFVILRASFFYYRREVKILRCSGVNMRLGSRYFRSLDVIAANELVLTEAKKCLGAERYDYTVQQKNRLCELLLQNDKLKGLFVCMKQLQGSDLKTFEIKEFCVLDKGLQTDLWERVKSLAVQKQAEWISARVRDEESRSFLLNQGFEERTVEGEGKSSSSFHQLYLSIKRSPSSNSSILQSRSTRALPYEGDIFETVRVISGEKRKRSADDIGAREGGEMQRKIRKTEPDYEQGSRSSLNEHYLPMKGEIFLRKIIEGVKKFEGRIYRATCKKMSVGDRLRLYDHRAGWGILCEITSLDVYKSFETMLREKGILSMLPQLEEDSKRLSSDELMKKAVSIYEAFPGSSGVNREGVVAIGVKFLEKV